MNTRTSEAIFNNPLLTEAVKKIAQISMRELSESICADLDEALQVHKHLCAIEQSYEEAFKSLSPRELSPGDRKSVV